MPAQASTAHVVRNVALWILQVPLAAYLAYSGYTLFGDDYVAKFDDIGLGQWLRYVTGVLEIGGAIGLLIPPLCGLAAIGLALVMLGAVGTELFLVDNGDAVLPLTLMVAAAVVAWFRRDTVPALLTRLRR
ncbi:MAG TPA: DoxX family protein [Actinophytocola sp.]|uniref:DoxX family protein n=1 Tax=Actinophytocola sp. TaxID=1872138 RepID=UPI002DDDB399|nr:DoxX family protein [Actinophytocola sp.]HEV2782267.1 DoxX family protein [Actinophytocola sp.]